MHDYKKELEEFAYIVSHDFSAPLRHIKQFGALLDEERGDKLTDQEKDYWSFIETSIIDMESMFASLLQYSRINTEAKPYSVFDCNEAVQAVTENLRDQIDQCHALVNFSDLPENLYGEKKQISDLFRLFLDNAIQFRSVCRQPEITISAKEKDGFWVFCIEDNGLGIIAEAKDHIFTLFRKAHTEETYNGVGAGLAIAKKIVTNHGGEVWFESKEGEGSQFYFTIPIQDDALS